MEPAFWSIGAVPAQLLGALALPRPQALDAVRVALAEGGFAVVSGAPGCGKSTFALQVAAALGRPTIVISSDALLMGDEADHVARLGEEAASRRAPFQGWADAPAALGVVAPLLVLDGLDARQLSWARTLASTTNPVLAVGPPNGIVPDPIAAEAAQDFLARRMAHAGKTWTGAAVREAAELAAGAPEDLQRIGAACLHAAREAGKSRIGLDILLEGSLAAAHPLPTGHAQRLSGLPPSRLALLKAMARFPDESPTQWAHRCGLDPKAVTVHLHRLDADDGLVTRATRGAYRIRWPLVALHLQSRYGTVVRTLPTPEV